MCILASTFKKFEAQAVTLQAVRQFLATYIDLCGHSQAKRAGDRMGGLDVMSGTSMPHEGGSDNDGGESPLPLAERLALRSAKAKNSAC